MAEERVSFEFDYDHGSTWGRHDGPPRQAELDRVPNGAGADWLAIEGASHRDAENLTFVPGAFIEELLRRALVFAAEGGSAQVEATHLDLALREIVLAGGALNRSLLGFEAQG